MILAWQMSLPARRQAPLECDDLEEAETSGPELQEPDHKALPRAADVGEAVSSKPVKADDIQPSVAHGQALGAGLKAAEPAADFKADPIAVKVFEDVDHVPETESVAATSWVR